MPEFLLPGTRVKQISLGKGTIVAALPAFELGEGFVYGQAEDGRISQHHGEWFVMRLDRSRSVALGSRGSWPVTLVVIRQGEVARI